MPGLPVGTQLQFKIPGLTYKATSVNHPSHLGEMESTHELTRELRTSLSSPSSVKVF